MLKVIKMIDDESPSNPALEYYSHDDLLVSWVQEWLKQYNESGDHPTSESNVVQLLENEEASKAFTPDVVKGILKAYKYIPDSIRSALVEGSTNYKPPKPSEGEILCLAVNETDNRGVAHTAKVFYSDQPTSRFDASTVNFQQVIETAVSCVHNLYKQKRMLVPVWEDDRYSFRVSRLISLEKEDLPMLSGDSIGLGFALAYFSALTQQKVPGMIAVTGALDENGEALHVDGINEKLSCLPNDRDYIKKALYPSHCEAEISSKTKHELIRTGVKAETIDSLETAIYSVFGDEAFEKAKLREISAGESLSVAEKYENERHCKEAIRIYEKVLEFESKKDHPEYEHLFEAAFGLMNCYDHTSELSKAEEFVSEAKRYFRKLPPESRKLLENRLVDRNGVLQTDKFFFTKAESIFKNTLRKVSKESPKLRGTIEGHLGQLYLKWHQYEKAQTRLRASTESFKKDGHPSNLAKNYCYVMELQGATAHFKEARKTLELVNKYTQEAIDNNDYIGTQDKTQRFFNMLQQTILYEREGNYKLAASIAEEALQLYRTQFEGKDDDFPHLGRLQAYYGTALFRDGKCSLGTKILFDGISSFKKAASPDTDLYAATVHLIISLDYLTSGRAPEAGKQLKEAFGLMHGNSSSGVRRYFATEIRSLQRILKVPSLSKVPHLEKRIQAIIDKVPL